MHQLEKDFRIQHDLFGTDATDGLQSMAHKRDAHLTLRIKAVLKNSNRDVLGDLAQAVVRVFKQGDILPDTSKDGSAIGGQLGLGAHLRLQPAYHARRQLNTVLVAPVPAFPGCRNHAANHPFAILAQHLAGGG